jgi:murein biosynthesis integral membrane protein MurJ
MTRTFSNTSAYLRAVTSKAANRQIFRALLSLASAALLIRVMGMLNQIVVTSHFGAGSSMDAYFISSVLPILLASLLASAIEASVIPAYTGVRSRGTKEEASRLFSTLLNLFILSSLLVTLLMLLLRTPLILLSAPGSPANTIGIAIYLAPFIFPVFALQVVIYYLECILNTEGQFGWPAYAGMLVPLITAIFVFTMGNSHGVMMLCIGMVVGLGLQLFAFMIGVRRSGISYKFILEVRNPEITSIVRAGWPLLIGALIGQASNLIDQIFASFLPPGSISALNYSLKLVSVFTGVIFVSVGRAVLPYLSRQASMNDMKSFKELLRLYLWVVGIVTTLLSVFVIILAHPLVAILFQRGAFNADDTSRTATTFIGFAVGLTPIAFGFIAFRAFSAIGKTRILLQVSLISMVVNAIFDYLFFRIWQSEGIALATSVTYVCSMFILFYMLRREIGALHLFTPPAEIGDYLRKVPAYLGLSRRKIQGNSIFTPGSSLMEMSKQKVFPAFRIPYRLQKQIIRFGAMIAVFTMGVVGVFLNSLNTLRISAASIFMLVLMRYNFLLLIAWILITGPNAMPIFRGSNILVGLTVPTLLLMLFLPIKQTLKRLPALGFVCIYLLWASASLIISPIGLGSALTAWTLELNCVTVSILAINVVTTQRRLLVCIDTLLLVAACIALYGIYGYFTKQNVLVDPTTSLTRIISIFAAAPGLAFFLSIFIPLSLYRTYTLQGLKRIIGMLLTLILLLAAALTFTRSAFIYIPVSIVVMALCMPSRQIRKVLIGSIAALAVILIPLVAVGNIAIFSRFASGDIATLNGRTYLWQAILNHFDPTKLLGNGIMASNALLTYLHIGANGGVIGTSPHALFLGTLYDNGVIGVILLSAAFMALAINLIVGMRRASGERRVLFSVALAVLVSAILQSIDSNDFWDPSIDIYIWIVLVLPFALYWNNQEQQAESADEDYIDEPTEPKLRALRIVGKGTS